MKNTKQSAVSRRMSKTDSGSVFQNLETTVNNLTSIVLDTSSKTGETANTLQTVKQIAEATQSLLSSQLDTSNAGSVLARIEELEQNPSGGGGGGGIDPTDPNQPILIWDNFITQGNGDPSGSVTPYSFSGSGTRTGSSLLTPNGPEIFEAPSETDHVGVVKAVVDLDGYLALSNSSTLDLVNWENFNRAFFIIKPVTTTTNYTIQVGLFDDINTPTKGVYVTGTRGSDWEFETKDTGTTTVSATGFANDWITIKIEKLSATSAVFQINDDAEVIITTNVPSGYFTFGIRCLIDTNPFEFLIDFFSLKLFGTQGELLETSTESVLKQVRNTSGSTIQKGKVVRIVGSQGATGLLLVDLADNSSVTADDVVGFAVEDIPNNKNGYIIKEGYLNSLATNTWGADGDRLYLGSSGNATNVRAAAPAHPVKLGWIVNSGAGTSGSIYVSIEHGEHLENLHDVLINSPSNDQALAYDSATGLWKNKTLAGGGGPFFGPPNYEETKSFSYDVNGDIDTLTWIVDSVTYTQNFYYTVGGDLDYIEWTRDGNTYRKTFTWNLDGSLASAVITEVP